MWIRVFTQNESNVSSLFGNLVFKSWFYCCFVDIVLFVVVGTRWNAWCFWYHNHTSLSFLFHWFTLLWIYPIQTPHHPSSDHHCLVVDSFRCPSPRETTLVWRCDASGDVLVSLTQTKSRGKEHKDDVVNKIREAVDAFKYIYVLEFDNMRTNAFKDLRGQLSDCR